MHYTSKKYVTVIIICRSSLSFACMCPDITCYYQTINFFQMKKEKGKGDTPKPSNSLPGEEEDEDPAAVYEGCEGRLFVIQCVLC